MIKLGNHYLMISDRVMGIAIKDDATVEVDFAIGDGSTATYTDIPPEDMTVLRSLLEQWQAGYIRQTATLSAETEAKQLEQEMHVERTRKRYERMVRGEEEPDRNQRVLDAMKEAMEVNPPGA